MADADDPPDDENYEERADKYYRGTIHKLRRGAQRGSVRSANGRDLQFIFAFVTMVGPHQHFDDLREGMTVGYDVSWTSHGLRVSVIRIPD